MVMPEGWNKLVSDKGPGLNDSQLAREIDFAMGLMKEMAEVLEKLNNTADKLLEMRDDINKFALLNPEVVTYFAKPILKKFQEWK